MKKSTILMAAGLAVAGFGTASRAQAQNYPGTSFSIAADPNGNLIGLTTKNGRLVWDFIDMWFNKGEAPQAWDKYVARVGFYNHAVYNSTTATVNYTFAQEKAAEAGAAGAGGPGAPPGPVPGQGPNFALKQIVAEGNLVFVHIAARPNPQNNRPGAAVPAAATGGDGKGPDEMIMILRVKNGKIVDHWDIHVPTNSNSVVFAGLDRAIP